MEKTCFKCNTTKPITDFYKHPQMTDGHINKCKSCTRNDNRLCNGNYRRTCRICKKDFNTTLTEIKRGGGFTCSRECYYKRFRKIVKRGEESPNWKGDEVGITALHNWVERELGKPRECKKCRTTESKFYDWANISREYKRELSDWIRLCRKCHIVFDGGSPRQIGGRTPLTLRQFIKS